MKLLRDTRGASLVEYIILVGVVALLCVSAFKAFGGKIQSKVNDQGSKVDQIGN